MTRADELADIVQQMSTRIGVVRREEIGVLQARDFARYAVAVGDLQSQYFPSDDQAGAPASAPPLFLSGVIDWGPGAIGDKLRPDGTGRHDMASFPAEGLRLVGGGQEVEIVRPPRAGDRVSVEISLESVELKSGSRGPFALIGLLRTYLDDDERELVHCHERYIGL